MKTILIDVIWLVPQNASMPNPGNWAGKPLFSHGFPQALDPSIFSCWKMIPTCDVLCFQAQQIFQKLLGWSINCLNYINPRQKCEPWSPATAKFSKKNVSPESNWNLWIDRNMKWYEIIIDQNWDHRIGWWENLQESPIFDGKNHGFL